MKHCIVLAAGRNSRLDTGKPKSLLEINGMALMEHHFMRFSQVGVKHFCIVTGYNPKPIEVFVCGMAEKYDVTIDLVHNERFDLENGYSLSAAKDWVRSQYAEQFYLTMGDHYFQPTFVEAFRNQVLQPERGLSLYLAVDKPGEWNGHIDIEDVTKVQANDLMQIEAIGKQLASYNYYDTGLFAMRAGVFGVLKECFVKQKFSLSNMVSSLISNKEAEVILLPKYFWNDVDNLADLENTRLLLGE